MNILTPVNSTKYIVRGEALKTFRAATGISMRDFGALIGVSGGYIAQLERDGEHSISAATARRLKDVIELQQRTTP